MKLNLSADLAVVISLITVFLFANGNAYIGGYLNAFNVDPIILNYSVQDKIYIGYLKGFNYLIFALLALIISMAAWHIWLAFDGSRNLNNYLDKKLNIAPRKHAPVIHNSTFHDELQSSYSKKSTLSFVVIVTLVGTLLLLSHTEKTARAEAFEHMKAKSLNLVSLNSTKEKNTHYEVLCGSTLCAIMNRENKIVTFEEVKNLEFTPKDPPEN